MGRASNGVGQPLNAFALVTYVPDPLARFLDDLRRVLIPMCIPHAHVTILPPRPIAGRLSDAAALLRSVLPAHPRFEATIEGVAVFPMTGVIYLELGQGRREFVELHEALNRDALAFPEPYPYHPHITLAQEIPLEAEEEVFSMAQDRWKNLGQPKSFPVEVATFVESALPNVWVDLEEFSLGAVAPVG